MEKARFTMSLGATGLYGPINIDDGGTVAIDATWVNAHAAIGVFTFEKGNDPAAAGGVTIAESTAAAFVAQQPGHASDAGGFFIDGLTTSASQLWVRYTRTSGGAGDNASFVINQKPKGA